MQGASLTWFGKCTAAARLVDGLFSAAGISFSAQLAAWRRSSGTLFACAGRCLCEFLSLAGKARLGHGRARATGAFRTTLAAVRLSFVRVSFSGPLVLNHSTTWTRRSSRRRGFSRAGFLLFCRFHYCPFVDLTVHLFKVTFSLSLSQWLVVGCRRESATVRFRYCVGEESPAFSVSGNSVLPASRWQGMVGRQIGEGLLRSCAIAALSAGRMPAAR